MNLGFTGTRHGLTEAQHATLDRLIDSLQADVLHHGACLGADTQAAALAHHDGLRVVAHPATGLDRWQSQVALDLSDEVCQSLPPLERNRAIVDACDVLLACPAGRVEEQRSGTWATVRYAHKQGKRVIIFYPEGDTVDEKGSADS